MRKRSAGRRRTRGTTIRLSRAELQRRYLDFLRSLRRHRPETRGTYARALREFLRWNARDTKFRFRPEDVTRYRRHLTRARSLSTVSVATYLTALRRLCAYLVSTGTLASNPARGITAYRRPREHTHTALSREAVDRLLAAVGGTDELALRDGLILRLMLYCALTESEVVRANVVDLNTHDGVLAVPGKGRKGKDATVPLGPPVRERIEEYLGMRGNVAPSSPLVVTAGNSSRGRRMTTRAVRDRINMYLESVGLRNGPEDTAVTPYSLRLTAALLLRNDGATAEEIQKQLRLGTLTTARIYAHVRQTAGTKAT
jgi:integrase/recombinase XerC/integrase/recombinase XerD